MPYPVIARVRKRTRDQMPNLRVRELTHKTFYIIHHVLIANEERAALVQTLRHDIQNTVFTVTRFTASLFRQERHRVALIQQTQFPFRVARGARVEVDPTFEQVTMEIRHQ